jgi:hypothetical protein
METPARAHPQCNQKSCSRELSARAGRGAALYLVELDAGAAGLDAAAAGLAAAALSPPLAAFVSLPELLSVFAPAAALGALPLLE